MVIDDTVDLRDLVLRIAAFFRDESCGQCVPCRVGTVQMHDGEIEVQSTPGMGTTFRVTLPKA